MHYYQFHIGDYRAGTIYLTQIERWVYRDLLDCLYDTEEPLPLDLSKVCMMVGARSDEHKEAVRIVLETKFMQTDQGYTNSRFESELDKYRSKAQRAIDANKKRWGYDSGLKSDVKSDANQIATNNQEPITNKNNRSSKMIDPMFNLFWDTFADKRSRGGAEKVWKRINPDAELAQHIIDGAKRYVQSRGNERKYWKQAQGWLNDRRWEDDTEPSVQSDSFDDISNWENWK